MPAQLTREFADSVELSRNPLTRHGEVEELLGDPHMVGKSVGIEVTRFTTFALEENDGSLTLGVPSVLPLLGRAILRKTVPYVQGYEIIRAKELKEN